MALLAGRKRVGQWHEPRHLALAAGDLKELSGLPPWADLVVLVRPSGGALRAVAGRPPSRTVRRICHLCGVRAGRNCHLTDGALRSRPIPQLLAVGRPVSSFE